MVSSQAFKNARTPRGGGARFAASEGAGAILATLSQQIRALMKKRSSNFASIFRDWDKSGDRRLDRGELKKGVRDALGIELSDGQAGQAYRSSNARAFEIFVFSTFYTRACRVPHTHQWAPA